MKKQMRTDADSRPAGEINRRRFLKASVAGVAMPWVLAPAEKGLGALGANAASGPDPLAEGFRTPPDSAKPWCYWWWLDSNAAKEGITADLEEMKRQGIAGALIFDAGKGTNPSNDDFKPRIRGGNDFDPVQGARFTHRSVVYGTRVAGIIQVCRSGSKPGRNRPQFQHRQRLGLRRRLG